MSEMKMSDVFTLPVSCEEVAEIGTEIFLGNEDAYAAFAINNYDRLLEENANLRKMLTQLQIEGGLGVARHRQINRLLNQLKDQNND